MPITTTDPITIPATPETTCNLVWLDSVTIDATARYSGPTNVGYVAVKFGMATDGVTPVFSATTTAYRLDDIFTLAQDPARPKLAALIAALLDAAAEDLAIREAQQ